MWPVGEMGIRQGCEEYIRCMRTTLDSDHCEELKTYKLKKWVHSKLCVKSRAMWRRVEKNYWRMTSCRKWNSGIQEQRMMTYICNLLERKKKVPCCEDMWEEAENSFEGENGEKSLMDEDENNGKLWWSSEKLTSINFAWEKNNKTMNWCWCS